jgi:hypothetical protein
MTSPTFYSALPMTNDEMAQAPEALRAENRSERIAK